MKSITRSTFVKIALVPVTAALAGSLLVMLLYIFQPSSPQKGGQGIYQDQVGIFQSGSQMVTTDGSINIF